MTSAQRKLVGLAFLAAACYVTSAVADNNKTCMSKSGGCAEMTCQPQFGSCTKDGMTVNYSTIKAKGTDVGTCGGTTGDCPSGTQHACVTDYCKPNAGNNCGEILCTVTVDVVGCT